MVCGVRGEESLLGGEGRLNNTVSGDGMWRKGEEELDWREERLNNSVSRDGIWGRRNIT